MTAPVNGLRSHTGTDDWEEALASGNGRQGVLAYGRPEALRFTVSHERLFLPLHEPLDPPHTAAILPELRALLAAGRYQGAADAAHRAAVAEHPGYADVRDSDPFVGAATLEYTAGTHPAPAYAVRANGAREQGAGEDAARAEGGPEVTGYHRTVDFRTGVVTQAWRVGAARMRVEAFVSRPDDVVVIRLPGGPGGALRLGPIAGRPPRPVRFTGLSGSADDGWLALRARFAYADGWPGALPGYTVLCRIVSTANQGISRRSRRHWSGQAQAHPGGLRPGGSPARPETAGDPGTAPGSRPPTGNGAEAGNEAGPGDGTAVELGAGAGALLLLRTLPGEVDLDEAIAALAALPADYIALLSRHAAAHGDLYDRAGLRLAEHPGPATGQSPALGAADTANAAGDDGLDSEDLLAAGGPALVERLFAAGRHWIISATGDLPPNLQGVWSGTWRPPWSGDYTLDGNLQSAVAALLATGTPELMLPVFDLLDRFGGDFARNARRLYGAPGIMLPAHCATHGRHNHFNPTWCLTFWTAGAAWFGRLYHDYWRHTGDRDFLARRAWPFLTAAADFYCDFARVVDGVATFSPSYSPENSPAGAGPQACVDATMDAAAVRDLLRNLLAAAGELGLADPREPRWRDLLAALPGYRMSAAGELAEWLPPGLADNHAHRHASQLFGLWYEPDPDIVNDPTLRAAATETVRRRLAWWRGADADEMAFGLVQLGLAAAHLGLADEAYEAVCALTRYWRPNLISTHNLGALLNTDICGGLPAVVLAMLATSAHGRVALLPALPAAWSAGELTGVRLRGPLALDRLRWRPGEVEATLRPAAGGRLELALPAGLRLAELAGAELAGAEMANPEATGAGRTGASPPGPPVAGPTGASPAGPVLVVTAGRAVRLRARPAPR